MNKFKKKVVVLLSLALTLAAVVPVAAQEGEIPSCTGESVSGTVVDVDEDTGVVTVYSDAGLCSVTLDSEYDHPIVDLLGSYFDDVSAESLTAPLDDTDEARQGYAVYDPETDTWSWADPDAEGAEAVTVIAENEEGFFMVLMDGEVVAVSVEDEETADSLRDALETLAVAWDLAEDGSVVQPGDEIAAYHEDGMGFGVLVKLYAMAAASQEACDEEESTEPCGVTVEELVAAIQAGAGIGDLFKDYVRPSITGIGHVRGKGHGKPDHAGPKDRDNPPDDDDIDDDVEDEDLGSQGRGSPPGHADRKKNGPPDHAGPKKPKPKKNKNR